jgi:hypothetical protein
MSLRRDAPRRQQQQQQQRNDLQPPYLPETHSIASSAFLAANSHLRRVLDITRQRSVRQMESKKRTAAFAAYLTTHEPV